MLLKYSIGSKKIDFYKSLPQPFFILAPMDDVTDTVFRQIINQLSRPDVFFTEFINVDGLNSSARQKLEYKLHFRPEEKPLIIQLWGKNPENFRTVASEIANRYHFDGIDLNFGCPDKTVVKNGCCSALINNRSLAQEIIQATLEGAGDLPVSIKTRLGFNEVDLSWIEFVLKFNIKLLTVHARTKKQMSKVEANWSYFDQIKRMRDKINPEILLVGNGDVKDRHHGLELCQQYGLNGVMIGRGVLKNPLAFSQSPNQWFNYSAEQRINLFKIHLNLFQKTYQEYGNAKLFKLFKFAKLYINDFKDSSNLRQQIMEAKSIEQVNALLDNFLINHL